MVGGLEHLRSFTFYKLNTPKCIYEILNLQFSLIFLKWQCIDFKLNKAYFIK